ncbi:hypothetical protein [Oryza sativa Japonica Group]|uniref:Uncharacterized protein n=2 Tax=Oryza sativa subsp. japonica TaxID=39947 RepID=A3A097_ORYSJ|nr:hypothetical protein OsJ_04313 [Oryza sativa Japonica Group]BAD82575.1 hypothetical protein [Oryza sativa Japonica Group]
MTRVGCGSWLEVATTRSDDGGVEVRLLAPLLTVMWFGGLLVPWKQQSGAEALLGEGDAAWTTRARQHGLEVWMRCHAQKPKLASQAHGREAELAGGGSISRSGSREEDPSEHNPDTGDMVGLREGTGSWCSTGGGDGLAPWLDVELHQSS